MGLIPVPQLLNSNRLCCSRDKPKISYGYLVRQILRVLMIRASQGYYCLGIHLDLGAMFQNADLGAEKNGQESMCRVVSYLSHVKLIGF